MDHFGTFCSILYFDIEKFRSSRDFRGWSLLSARHLFRDLVTGRKLYCCFHGVATLWRGGGSCYYRNFPVILVMLNLTVDDVVVCLKLSFVLRFTVFFFLLIDFVIVTNISAMFYNFVLSIILNQYKTRTMTNKGHCRCHFTPSPQLRR